MSNNGSEKMPIQVASLKKYSKGDDGLFPSSVYIYVYENGESGEELSLVDFVNKYRRFYYYQNEDIE